MNILAEQVADEVAAVDVRFDQDMLVIVLSDEREIALPFKKIKWLHWLAEATPEQRAKWSIEPYGYAVWWEDLDDGIEVVHILSRQPLPHRNQLIGRFAGGPGDTAEKAKEILKKEVNSTSGFSL